MKKILVTGGKGYIGSKLVKALEANGHSVKIFDKPLDVCNEKQIDAAIKGMDVVYHLAALAEIKYTTEHPEETFDVNIIGGKNIARACLKHGAVLNFVSTCCIYGNPLETPSVEDRLINPTDLYAMSKAAGEWIVKMWGLKGLKFNILRFGTVYGQSTDKEMRGDMAIQKFLKAAIEKKGIYITGDGSQNRNFIHIDDLVNGLVLVNEKNVIGETINFAGSEKISIQEIANYAMGFGVTGVTNTIPRQDDFHDQDVSNEKALRLLGWKPQVKFEDGIKDMYEWLCQQQ
jgi:UDP-glucose 4-epimerase